jgi:ketosteroid isomerase-like protein
VLADTETREAVLAVMDRFNEAVGAKRLGDVVGLFVSDPDVTMLGSEQAERAVGPAELAFIIGRLLARQSTYSWRWHQRQVSVSAAGDVAWVEAVASISDGRMATPYRMTLVLERRGGHWLIAQYHGSEPLPPPDDQFSSGTAT